uniref:Major facilitator superfamily (MFS) profile domain-containing protein n=1 Tax=Timema douglasi TaxID=61478 RepID=A0A7R8VRX0_TIMDO|nr:unnamed protein product [Timema douglasi]
METDRTLDHATTEAVGLLSFATGTVVGWSSPTLPSLQSEYSPIGGPPITKESASWIGSSMCFGAFIGVPIYNYICNKYSRKLSGYLSAVPLVPSWFLVTFANSEVMLYIARFIAGLTLAAGGVFHPLYVAEISEDSVRGRLSASMMLMYNIGIVFFYLVGWYLPYTTTGYIGLTIVIIYLLVFSYVPETPYYLMSQGKILEAMKTLKWLRGNNNPTIEGEFESLSKRLKDVKANKSASLKDLFATRGSRKALMIGIGIIANSQLCGYFVVLVYSVSIFQEAESTMTPSSATILVGLLQLVGSSVSTFTVDHAGRRTLLILSNAFSAICLGVIGTYSYLKQSRDMSEWGWIPVVCLSMFIVSNALGVSPLRFLIISEIFSIRTRGMANTVCICVMWVVIFLVTKFFVNISNLIGLHGCYWLFSLCCVLGWLFCYFFVPETKNRNLESILKELNGDSIVADLPRRKSFEDKQDQALI